MFRYLENSLNSTPKMDALLLHVNYTSVDFLKISPQNGPMPAGSHGSLDDLLHISHDTRESAYMLPETQEIPESQRKLV